jgi:16S rRNA (adenine1518-N6/adenine1519-N6)-dimethyltransferase
VQHVKAKKHFGQHFLNDASVAQRITAALQPRGRYRQVLEVGPGMGVLSQFLFQRAEFETKLIEIDTDSVRFLREKFPDHVRNIAEGDFLKMDLRRTFAEPFAIIGNFPYNISTQILFSVLGNRDLVPEVVGMFQKEVGERIASPPGNRDYGIPSVFMQAWFDVELLMTLDENDFSPPPKVKSCVLRFERKENFVLGCDEKKFFNVVKTAFNQRRKMLGNGLLPLLEKEKIKLLPYITQRAEQLSWQQFVDLTNRIEEVRGGA